MTKTFGLLLCVSLAACGGAASSADRTSATDPQAAGAASCEDEIVELRVKLKTAVAQRNRALAELERIDTYNEKRTEQLSTMLADMSNNPTMTVVDSGDLAREWEVLEREAAQRKAERQNRKQTAK